jgi:3,4-dihydroxyphenylacetate 2,3-dioxygenase
MSGIIAGAVVPHTPRMGIEANAPEFVRGLIDGERELGILLRELQPDLIVLQSSHWVSTFSWYVTAHEVHEGICIADEAPDMIPGVPYRWPGDAEFAKALAQRLNDAGVPCGLNDTPHFRWDYGSYVPLHYLDPCGEVPVVLLPTVICSGLEENLKVGRLVQKTATALGRRTVHLASCALSHAIRRGPELWPSQEMQDMDNKFVAMMCDGDVAGLVDWLPDYSRNAVAEMGGRPLAGLLGALQSMAETTGPLTGRQFGAYGQSSGSGNAAVALWPAAREMQ